MSAADSRQHRERPQQARVFFALWPTLENAHRLAALAGEFAGTAGGRATRPETIHLTLAFIGDVALERLTDLERAARDVKAASFDLTLDRFELWRHNRIFWAGCSSVPPALVELTSELGAALQAAGFHVADQQRAFVPHVTLVRKVAQHEPLLPACTPLTWPCTNFVLVRSTLAASGSSYQQLAEFALEGSSPRGVRPVGSGS